MNRIDVITSGNKSGFTVERSATNASHTHPLVVSLLIAISLVTLSLRVFTLYNGYVVTFAALMLMFYCLYIANHIRASQITFYLFVICFLLMNALGHFTTLDIIEFIKSFLLTSVMMFVYITSLKPQDELRKLIKFSLILKVSTYLILGFELIQIFEQLLIGSYSSWFWLDGTSISTAKSVERFEAVFFLGYIRPLSFFHEPSYLAAISFILLLINDRTTCIKHVSHLLIASIILSLSAIGIGILLVYLAHKLLYKNIALFTFCTLSAVVFFPIYENEALAFLRLPEIFVEGTSGYIRLVEPLLITYTALNTSFLGIPLGQSEVVFNNSLYLIFLYFGLLSPFLISAWIFVAWSGTKGIMYFANYSLGIAFLLLVSGAIFTLESAFLLLLLNYSFMGHHKQ